MNPANDGHHDGVVRRDGREQLLGGTQVAQSRTLAREELLAEREELSRTVQALVERFDVGSRARAAADSARASGQRALSDAVRSPLFVPLAAAVGALIAAVAGASLWRRSTWRATSPGSPRR